MIYWAIVFLVFGLIAGGLGFGGLAGTAFGVAKGLLLFKVVGVLLILLAVGFAFAHVRSSGPTHMGHV